MENRRRTAVILTLGMLLENVDTDGFIVTMLKKAKEENSEFVFTPELQGKAFQISDKFNMGKLEPSVFESEILSLLKLTKVTSEEFWQEWNKMITVGNPSEKKLYDQVRLLQTMSEKNKSIVYFYSDTNKKHLELIAQEAKLQDLILNDKEALPTLAGLTVYTSCHTGLLRLLLIQRILNDITEKKFNKPDDLVLILGDPNNIKNEIHRNREKRKQEPIVALCKENSVSIVYHHNSLKETLKHIFPSDLDNENRINFQRTG